MNNLSVAGWVAAALLALLAPNTFAKPAAVTLPELVRKSSIIVRGKLSAEGDSVLKPGSGRVAFKISQVLKGDVSLGDRDIQLCNVSPPMREYPDLSKLTGEVVLFLDAPKDGCFEYSHTTTSVVGVRNGKIMTAGIVGQPVTQTWNEFVGKLNYLLSK